MLEVTKPPKAFFPMRAVIREIDKGYCAVTFSVNQKGEAKLASVKIHKSSHEKFFCKDAKRMLKTMLFKSANSAGIENAYYNFKFKVRIQ